MPSQLLTPTALLPWTGLLLLLATPGAAVSGEIYKYVDENGNVVFTDEPPAPESAETVEIEPYRPPSQTTPLAMPRSNRPVANPTEAAEDARVDGLISELEAGHRRRCTEAREALEILHQGMPVYRTPDGGYRAAWSGDTYAGTRTYLTDAQRLRAIDNEVRKLAINCEDPMNEAEQKAAWRDLHDREQCAASRKLLAQLKVAGSRTPDDEIANQQAIVDRFCGR